MTKEIVLESQIDSKNRLSNDISESLRMCSDANIICKKWSVLFDMDHIKLLEIIWKDETELFKIVSDQYLPLLIEDLPKIKVVSEHENAIFEFHKKLIYSQMKIFFNAFPMYQKEFDDLGQNAYFVFRRCLWQYDKTNKCMFSTYFVTSLKHFYNSCRYVKKKAIVTQNCDEDTWKTISKNLLVNINLSEKFEIEPLIEKANLEMKELIVVTHYSQKKSEWLHEANKELSEKLGIKPFSRQNLHNILNKARNKILIALSDYNSLHYERLRSLS